MKLTVREKRYLLAGVVIAAAIGIFYLFTSMAPGREKLGGDVEFKRRMLLGQREILLREDVYRQQVEQNRQGLDRTRTRLLPGDNSSVASAELQKVLKDFADQSGVEITQKNTLPEKPLPDNPGITRVAVRIETRCDLAQLVNFLTAIENYDKFLRVDELIVNSFRIQRRYEIRPSLTISGYIGSPNPASAESSGPETAALLEPPASLETRPER